MRGSPAERLVAQFRQTYPTLTTEEIMVKMAVVLLMEATPPAQVTRTTEPTLRDTGFDDPPSLRVTR